MPRTRYMIFRGSFRRGCLISSLGLFFQRQRAGRPEADLILHHGKIVTVDRDFSIRQALAVKGDRLIQVGSNEDVLKLRGPNTTVGRPRRQDGVAGPDRLARASDRRLHDRVRPSDSRDGNDRRRARLHSCPGRGPGPRASGSSSARSSSRDSKSSAIRLATSSTRPRPKPRPVRDRARCIAQLAGPEAERHRQGFPDRRAGQDRKRPAHRRADRHPPQLHAVRQSRRRPSKSRASTTRSGG